MMSKRSIWTAHRYDKPHTAEWWRVVKSPGGSTYWVRPINTNDGTVSLSVYTGANRRPASPKVADRLRHHFANAIERAST